MTWIGALKDTKNECFSPVKYSSLTKFLRVTAYLARFIYNCRHSKSERRIGTLLVEEIEQARTFWIRNTKRNHCLKKLQTSTRNNMFQARANWYRYHPFLMNMELFVPVDELREPIFHFCSRHSIVLSLNHEFTHVIVMNRIRD